MIAIIINCDKSIEKRAGYVFDTLFSVLGIPYEIFFGEDGIDTTKHSIIINYGCFTLSKKLKRYVESGGFIINILTHPEIIKDREKLQSTINQIGIHDSKKQLKPAYILKKYSEKGIPFFYPYISFDSNSGQSLYFYEDPTVGPAVVLNEQGKGFLVNIGADIISSVFYLLSREEEISKKRDRHNKFSVKSSIAYEQDFISRPIVNEYIELLYELIVIGFEKRNLPVLQKMHWPNGKKFAVCLAHDIDWLNKWKIGLYEIKPQLLRSGKLFLHFEFKSLVDLLATIHLALSRKNLYRNLKETVAIEDEFGYKSTFYFFGNRKNDYFGMDAYGGAYSITNDKIKRFIKDISKKGWEIGLHGSYNSYDDKSMLGIEKRILEETLGNEVKGVRQHYQRFDVPTTWEAQQHAGFVYDATLGYSDHVGFRASICFPFAAYNVLDDVRYKLMEIPLNVVDEILVMKCIRSSKALKEIKKFLEEIKGLIDTLKMHNGVMVLLWHPFEKYHGSILAYKKILKYLKELDAYVATCEEVVDWWDRRDSLKVTDVKHEDNITEWTIRAEKEIENIWFKIKCLDGDISINDVHDYDVIKKDSLIYVKITKMVSGDDIIVRYTRM